MHPKLEALMAHGRVTGVTQRVVTSITADGRSLRLAGESREVCSSITACSSIPSPSPIARRGGAETLFTGL